jgi:hypothetical protein
MSNKMMLLALAVAAMLAIPSAASAQEIHFTNVTSFSGTGGPSSLQASNEQTIKCTATSASGSFNAGSSTTGSITLDFTGCTAEFFGIKANCNTKGAAAGTIASGGTFHLITFVNSKAEKKPAILLTANSTTLICAGFSNTIVTGNVIGTITSPACGGKNKTLAVVFVTNGATQEHLEYTGVKYDLSAETETTSEVTAGLTASTTLTSGTEGTLECT